MSMFCYQCQETARNVGCERRGVCGKDDTTAGLMDVLVYTLKGLARAARKKADSGESVAPEGRLIMRSLFATITNANFDASRIEELVLEAGEAKRALGRSFGDGSASMSALLRGRE